MRRSGGLYKGLYFETKRANSRGVVAGCRLSFDANAMPTHLNRRQTVAFLWRWPLREVEL